MDLAARVVPRPPAAHKPLARLKDEGLDLIAANAEDRRYLLVRMIAKLEEHQRGALVSGQSLHVLERFA